MLSQGDLSVFYTHPLARNLFILSGIIIAAPLIIRRMKGIIQKKG